jgi:hypothetical protein
VYFPQVFKTILDRNLKAGHKHPIIITEGEKKAAKACAEGYLACAVGGVYNWRSKTLILGEGTEITRTKNGDFVAKLKGDQVQTSTADRRGLLANGMQKLIDLIRQNDLSVVIVFDSDAPPNPDVQRAAAELAYELRFNGIPTQHIRQLELSTTAHKKIGLDDYLVQFGSEMFYKSVQTCLASRAAYPTHPNMREMLSKALNNQLERQEIKELSLAILADMDVNGMRMVDKNTGMPFYFDGRTKMLMPVNLLHHHEEPLHETRFGQYLYQQYDLSQVDSKLLTWLAASFTGEQPIEFVEPKSVFTLTKEGLAYQVDDGHFVQVTADPEAPIVICTNGSNGILFKADQVEPIDAQMLTRKVKQEILWLQEKPDYDQFYWAHVTKQFKWVNPRDAKIMTILSYLSPWLQRWRAAQLPVELMIGEPGSGKSSMYALRLNILTGRPALRNLPTDIRDWYASITSQGGMHVIDNIAFATKELKQRLSDEMCRIVTEPQPMVEMRKLFTTSDNIRIPVNVVFGMTAIQQPFVNADIMQRSVIMELHAIGEQHSSDWSGDAMRKRGGRIGWLAHQLAVLHVFFARVKKEGTTFWDPEYRSKHRLAHFEQLFRAMGSVLNIPDLDELAKSLSASSQDQVSEHDWTMEGLKAFHEAHIDEQRAKPKRLFSTQDISMWGEEQSEFADNQIFTNSRRLSRYIKSHLYMVENLVGIREYPDKIANRQMFQLMESK